MENGFTCDEGEGRFTTKRGLGVHKRREHPFLANEKTIMVKRWKWYAEELRVIAREEVITTKNNVHLHQLFPESTIESIKGQMKAYISQCLLRLINRCDVGQR